MVIQNFLISHLSMRRKKHKYCSPCSLEGGGSHFIGCIFHSSRKGTSSAAHNTNFFLSLYTTKMRHWDMFFSCKVSDQTMQSTKQEAFILLKYFYSHNLFYFWLWLLRRLIFFFTRMSYYVIVLASVSLRWNVTENQRYFCW